LGNQKLGESGRAAKSNRGRPNLDSGLPPRQAGALGGKHGGESVAARPPAYATGVT
jgi:hypothetical protein